MASTFFLCFILSLTGGVSFLFCCNFCGVLKNRYASIFEADTPPVVRVDGPSSLVTVTAVEVVDAHPVFV